MLNIFHKLLQKLKPPVKNNDAEKYSKDFICDFVNKLPKIKKRYNNLEHRYRISENNNGAIDVFYGINKKNNNEDAVIITSTKSGVKIYTEKLRSYWTS